MLRTRIATALLLIISVGGILLYAPVWVFNVLVVVVIGGALYEFYRLVFPVHRDYRLLGCTYGMGVACAMQWPWLHLSVAASLIVGCFGVCCIHMFQAATLERFVQRVGATCFGAVYIALGLAYFGWLRAADHGRTLVTMTIGMAALSDTFAYMFGRMIGQRKLAPLISPNKTVEGFIAGFGGSVVAALICRAILWPELLIGPLIGLGLLIGLVAPLGDLIESAIKRAYHVKDSGAMLPGHGGVLDRADAYIFSAPAVYYYVKYVMGVM